MVHALLHSPSGITSRVSWQGKESCGCKAAKMQRGKGLRAGKCRPKAQAKSAEPQGQSHKGAALSSPSLYTLPESKTARGQWDSGQRITVGSAVSPSWPGLMKSGTVRTRLVGYLTISGLGWAGLGWAGQGWANHL